MIGDGADALAAAGQVAGSLLADVEGLYVLTSDGFYQAIVKDTVCLLLLESLELVFHLSVESHQAPIQAQPPSFPLTGYSSPVGSAVDTAADNQLPYLWFASGTWPTCPASAAGMPSPLLTWPAGLRGH